MTRSKSPANWNFLSATFFAVATLAALSSGIFAAQNPAPSDKEQIARGHKQFQQSCGFCHGPDATGARGPDLVRSPLVAHDVKGDLIGPVIRQGRVDKGMPALDLPADQIADIVAYLHSRGQDAINSADIPEAYPVEKLLTGNLEAGKTFFNGPGGCSNCHSPTGDLAHIAKKYPPVDLESVMLYPEKERATAVVTMPSGEQISGPIVHSDDFMIALRDSTGAYRSFNRDHVKVEIQRPLAEHRKLLDKITQTDLHNLFAYMESLK
jgi:cytochrome c oxidase cbb3-type subunit III